MIEKLNIADYHIPDGMLHDQRLEKVTFDKENEKLILQFGFRFFSDYEGDEFCRRYKNFTKCEMVCKIKDGPYSQNFVSMQVNEFNENGGKIRIISLEEFANLVNSGINSGKYDFTYLDMALLHYGVIIHLNCYNHEYKSFKIELELDEIEYNWQ